MANTSNVSNWNELNFLDSMEEFEQVAKQKGRSRKRKWREIESIKEKHRLKRELEEYEH